MHRSCACTSAKGHAWLANGTQNQNSCPRLLVPALHGARAAARHIGETAPSETASSPGEACSCRCCNAFSQQKDIPAVSYE